MLSTTTPFKIHDENSQAQQMTSTKKRALGVNPSVNGNGLLAMKTPQKSLAPSTTSSVTASKRKALVDLSSSQVNIRAPNATPSHSINLNLNKQPTTIIKAAPLSTQKPTTVLVPSSSQKPTGVTQVLVMPQPCVSETPVGDHDDEMICSTSTF